MFVAQWCQSTIPAEQPPAPKPRSASRLQVGAERLSEYLPLLDGKSVGVIVNPTSRVGDRHLVDTLLALGVQVQKIFAPEHGFRGTADAGDKISDGYDERTGLPVISLYGKTRKPGAAELDGLDVVVFDIQDVGARFYTYISTMHLAMEACAEFELPFLVLDRPNPNGHYVDGPVLDTTYRSFVGMHPIPVVHGLTVGELARMIQGEGWLAGGLRADLTVIPCTGYTHATPYRLPVAPSPNLPNLRSIYLYPSLCFFEGTVVSVGRGTDRQFQLVGHPDYPDHRFSFTPQPMPGATRPKHNGQVCYGKDLTQRTEEELYEQGKLDLTYLVDFYAQLPQKEDFIIPSLFIDRLAGGDALRKALLRGQSAADIRASWQPDLERYKRMRAKYLLYD